MAGTIDIDALRHFRANAQWDNWMKDLTTEQYQLIYEQPIYPRTCTSSASPIRHAEYRREVLEPQVRLLQERGIYAPADAPGGLPPEEPILPAPVVDPPVVDEPLVG